MSNLMYPGGIDVHQDLHGTATLPDGRIVNIHQEGYVEGDTNAFVESEDGSFTWGNGDNEGDELTNEEINEEIEHDGRRFFLHEYVWEFIKWD